MNLTIDTDCPSNIPLTVFTGNEKFKTLNNRRFSSVGELADSLTSIDVYVDPIIAQHVVAGLRPSHRIDSLSIIGSGLDGYYLAQKVGADEYICVARLELGNP